MRLQEFELNADFTAWAALTDTYATQLAELAQGDSTARIRLGVTCRALERFHVQADGNAKGDLH